MLISHISRSTKLSLWKNQMRRSWGLHQQTTAAKSRLGGFIQMVWWWRMLHAFSKWQIINTQVKKKKTNKIKQPKTKDTKKSPTKQKTTNLMSRAVSCLELSPLPKESNYSSTPLVNWNLPEGMRFHEGTSSRCWDSTGNYVTWE